MQVVYGQLRFPVNSCEVSTSQRLNLTDAGQPASWVKAARCEAVLITAQPGGASAVACQRDLLAQQAAVYRGMSQNYRNFALLLDDGTVALELDNVTSLSGVRVTQGPDFPVGLGAEGVIVRTVRFVVEAEYAVSGSAFLLQSFRETVSFRGGGPVYGFFEPVEGKAVKYLSRVTAYLATQDGQAVGVAGYPAVPGPLWPAALLVEAPAAQRGSPEFRGNLYRNFPVQWSYSFGSGDPLPDRAPHFWPT